MSNNCTDPTSDHAYGNLATQSQVFRVLACFQEVSAGCLNWDPVYCCSLAIYCVLSVINIGLLSYVMRYYRQS